MTGPYASAPYEPLRGDIPRVSTNVGLAEQLQPERVDDAEQMAAAVCTGWTDYTFDSAGRLLGRAHGRLGYAVVIDGPALAEWSRLEIPAWRQLDAAGWARVAELLADWWRGEDARRRDVVPEAQREVDAQRAARAAANRRAELERTRADADAALAALDAGQPAAPEPERPRPGGWLRRTP